MHYGRLKDKREYQTKIYTPPIVANFLHGILEHLKPEVVLDPCIGNGRLTEPWIDSAKIIGIDTDPISESDMCEFHQLDFLRMPAYIWDQPELILCNPPWAGSCIRTFSKTGKGSRRQCMAESFLRRIVELFGNKIPIALIVPAGFRMNQAIHSDRWPWIHDNLVLSGIVTLPRDTWLPYWVLSEILLFNVPKVKAHYWGGLAFS